MSVHSCVQPANARLSIKSKAGGVCSSPREVQFRRASRPMRLTALASRSCCSCEQCAKVPPRTSLISVCEMSTIRNLLQCSHAAGPIQLKKAGKNNDSIPASKKQPSGMERIQNGGIVFRSLKIALLQGAAFFEGSRPKSRLAPAD